MAISDPPTPGEPPAEWVEEVAAAICPDDYCEAHSECRECAAGALVALEPFIVAREAAARSDGAREALDAAIKAWKSAPGSFTQMLTEQRSEIER